MQSMMYLLDIHKYNGHQGMIKNTASQYDLWRVDKLLN